LSSYRKGRSAENYVKTKLKSMGFTAFRIAGSKPIDLVFSNNCCVFGAEVKAQQISQARAERLLRKLDELLADTPMIPVVIYKKGTRWVSLPEFVLR
jgi:Holliday junction resolvase